MNRLRISEVFIGGIVMKRRIVCLERSNPQNHPAYRSYWEKYHELMGREGVSPDAAQNTVRHNHAIIAALAVLMGDADAMICGLRDSFDKSLQVVRNIIGLDAGAANFAAHQKVLFPFHN